MAFAMEAQVLQSLSTSIVFEVGGCQIEGLSNKFLPLLENRILFSSAAIVSDRES